MLALPSRFGSLPIWLAAFAALIAVIGWETGWGGRIAPAPDLPAAPAPAPVALSLFPDYQIDGGIASRRDTVERPAFIPTRRPAPAPVQEIAKPRMPRGQFTLTGTAVVDQKQIAFLRETAGGKARSVRAGETINGVVVAEVKSDRVKLTMGDESEELVLKVAAGPRQTIQPPLPGVPGAPGAPGAAPPPARPQVAGQPVAEAPMDSDASILERRRAARATIQAQEAARSANQPVQTAPTSPAALAAPQGAAGPGAAAAPAPDPAWADVYRRMQQPRR